MEGKPLVVSFVAVGELFYWMEKNDWGLPWREQLKAAIRNFTVVPYDYRVAKCASAVPPSATASDNESYPVPMRG